MDKNSPTRVARLAETQRPQGQKDRQTVLVLQGGGALGAYQAGVYEALHETGIEPDWCIGTSIGAITAGLVCGNARERRLDRLREFWSRVEQSGGDDLFRLFTGLANVPSNLATIARGIPAFFVPSPLAWFNAHAPLGLDNAAYYTTSPLRETLAELIDIEVLNTCSTRLTVGAVNVATGRAVTLNALLQTLSRLTGRRTRAKRAKPRAGDIRHSLADISLARRVLGYRPTVDFRTGLERTVDWYTDQSGPSAIR